MARKKDSPIEESGRNLAPKGSRDNRHTSALGGHVEAEKRKSKRRTKKVREDTLKELGL